MALATFPRFIGGPNLGGTLNASMMAKAGIVGQLLAIIFPGVIVYLVQGSPSGSSASGGTHVDQGDAGDFTYGYADGRAAGLATYLMASILWRMLDCLSYVRGFDVNKDGVPDDSFSQHNHVIDREGGGKAWAVLNQIAEFVAHLDGLVGGRADREQVFPQTMTLAEYQTPAGRATFLLRFQALSREALGLAAHIEPTRAQEIDMMHFTDQAGTVWLATGDRATFTGSQVESSAVAKAIAGGQLTADEMAAFHDVQARLRPPVVPVVKLAGTDTLYAVTADGLVALPGIAHADALAVLQDGGALTKDQVAMVDQALAQGPQSPTTVTVNLDDAAAAKVADAVWNPIRKVSA